MKIRANKTIFTIATAFSAAVLLSACDEDFAEITNPGRQTAETLDALAECNDKNEGDIAYVKDAGALYLCADSAWKKMVASEKAEGHDGTNSKDGKNGADSIIGDKGADGDKGANGDAGADCSAKALTDGSGFELSCGGKVVGTIKNGQNGAKGENGTDCSGKVLEKGAGIELTCGGKVVGTFQNGVESSEAKDCIAYDKGDGNIAISCDEENTIIRAKALCGQNPYDPEKKVCLGVYKNGDIIMAGLAPLCNGKPYNPYTVDNEGKGFSPGDNIVINKLNVTTKQECKDGVIVNVCGDEEIDLERQFCYDKKIYDKCNGKNYNPNKEVCLDNKILNKCGDKGEGYDPKTHFCFEGEIFSKCDDENYDPATEVCKNGKVLTKCGDKGEGYDPKTQDCENGQAINVTLLQCGRESYNPNRYMCDDRDSSRVYKITTITIPEKDYSETWMAQNLNYATSKGNSYCAGSTAAEQIAFCAKYGRLYTWAAAVGKSEEECGDGKSCNLGDGDVQGVCPEGWHLPSNAEWQALCTAAGDESNAGMSLKSKTGWNAYTKITNDDTYAFTALPAGFINYNGDFKHEGEQTNFWTTEASSKYASIWILYYNNDFFDKSLNNKNAAQSVRCIKNKQ